MRTVLGLVMVWLAGGCGDQIMEPTEEPGIVAEALKTPGGGARKPTASPIAALTFWDAQSGQAATSFPIATTASIDIQTSWTRLAPGSTHTEVLRLYTPGGGLYQSWSSTFSAGATGSAGLTAILPVMGTTIAEYSMTGTWKAVVYLDGGATASATATFLLY